MPMNVSKANSLRQWAIWKASGAVAEYGQRPRKVAPSRMERVYQAEAYRYGAMGSLGDASYMLLRQHQFPDMFDASLDQMTGWDHDRIMQQQYEHGTRCFKEHIGTGEMGLEYWLKKKEATPEAVIAFLVDILKADRNIKWTGFRIVGSVHRGNGYPVWTLQLFAKHPESATVVYNTENAPNLIRGSRYAQREMGGKPNWTFDEFGVSH